MKYFSLMTSNRVVGYGKLRSGASVPTSVLPFSEQKYVVYVMCV